MYSQQKGKISVYLWKSYVLMMQHERILGKACLQPVPAHDPMEEVEVALTSRIQICLRICRYLRAQMGGGCSRWMVIRL